MDSVQAFNPALVLFMILFSHVLDILFTVLLIRKGRADYENPEEIEMNYHRWFFKKFGLLKGSLMSGAISL